MLQKQFQDYIEQQSLFEKKDRLLVAVSGGIDSVVLTHLLHSCGYDFAIAHCNFQLRGADSDADELFVKQLAESYTIPFYSIQFNTKAFCELQGVSIQEGARLLRYEWFADIAKHYLFDYILTAHHADDNIETVLMHFFRGTGIKGLTGIQQHGNIVRPLLFAFRTQLEAYHTQHGLSFVQDASNLKDDYTRNFFRNKLLPEIATIFPQAKENIFHNIGIFNDVEAIYRQSLQQLQHKLVQIQEDGIYIPVLKLKNTLAYKTVLYEIVKDYGFKPAQLPDIIHLLDAASGKYVASATHRIIKNRAHLIIAPNATEDKNIFVIDGAGAYDFASQSLDIHFSEDVSVIDHLPNHAFIDAALVQFPLILRPWRTGDYFYPLGMQKKKKLSRFLIDKKLSIVEKENVWVVEMNKKILWVINHRIDDRFKITPKTRQVLAFKVS